MNWIELKWNEGGKKIPNEDANGMKLWRMTEENQECEENVLKEGERRRRGWRKTNENEKKVYLMSCENWIRWLKGTQRCDLLNEWLNIGILYHFHPLTNVGGKCAEKKIEKFSQMTKFYSKSTQLCHSWFLSSTVLHCINDFSNFSS